jgi:hypothetical protein
MGANGTSTRAIPQWSRVRISAPRRPSGARALQSRTAVKPGGSIADDLWTVCMPAGRAPRRLVVRRRSGRQAAYKVAAWEARKPPNSWRWPRTGFRRSEVRVAVGRQVPSRIVHHSNERCQCQCLSGREHVSPSGHAIEDDIEEAAKMVQLAVRNERKFAGVRLYLLLEFSRGSTSSRLIRLIRRSWVRIPSRSPENQRLTAHPKNPPHFTSAPRPGKWA